MTTISSLSNYNEASFTIRSKQIGSPKPDTESPDPTDVRDFVSGSSAPGFKLASLQPGKLGYTGFSGTSMAGPPVSGMAILVGSTFGEKEEYVPKNTSDVLNMDAVGAAVEEVRATRRLLDRMQEDFGVTEWTEKPVVEKLTVPTSDMGLHVTGEQAFTISERVRSVQLQTKTHNFLMRESLDTDKTTIAVWNVGDRMPDVWERDSEKKNVLMGPSTKPVEPTPNEGRLPDEGRLAF